MLPAGLCSATAHTTFGCSFLTALPLLFVQPCWLGAAAVVVALGSALVPVLSSGDCPHQGFLEALTSLCLHGTAQTLLFPPL